MTGQYAWRHVHAIMPSCAAVFPERHDDGHYRPARVRVRMYRLTLTANSESALRSTSIALSGHGGIHMINVKILTVPTALGALQAMKPVMK